MLDKARHRAAFVEGLGELMANAPASPEVSREMSGPSPGFSIKGGICSEGGVWRKRTPGG